MDMCIPGSPETPDKMGNTVLHLSAKGGFNDFAGEAQFFFGVKSAARCFDEGDRPAVFSEEEKDPNGSAWPRSHFFSWHLFNLPSWELSHIPSQSTVFCRWFSFYQGEIG